MPDHSCLYQTASEQAGYFTTAQAEACGYSRPGLSQMVDSGRIRRERRGLYRLRDYPSSPHEHLVREWLAAGPESAISHESALELYDLSDIIPDSIHVTVPRDRRWYSAPGHVTVHTTTRDLAPDTMHREGVRVTRSERTIVDSAKAGSHPDQIIVAVREAVDRGLTTEPRMRQAIADRSARVRELVEAGLAKSA